MIGKLITTMRSLTPAQIILVGMVLALSSVAALGLACWFARKNSRQVT